MVYLFLFMAFQGLFCASAPEEVDSIGEHRALVQFKASDGVVYQVWWNTLGLMYNEVQSIEGFLEESFTFCNDCGCICDRTGFIELFLGCDADLAMCLRRQWSVSYEGLGGAWLQAKMMREQVFSNKEMVRQSKVLPKGSRRALVKEELRVTVDQGSLCFMPLISKISRRRLEGEEAFENRLRQAAEAKMLALQQAAHAEGECVTVQLKRLDGTLCGCVWDGTHVFDREGLLLGEFLRYCTLQGISFGYVDEGERHYAFANKYIRKVLTKRLSYDLLFSNNVDSLDGVEVLSRADVMSIPYLSWSVVAPDSTLKKDGCLLKFAGGALEGVHAKKSEFSSGGSLSRRCLLWALEDDSLGIEEDSDSDEVAPLKKARWIF